MDSGVFFMAQRQAKAAAKATARPHVTRTQGTTRTVSTRRRRKAAHSRNRPMLPPALSGDIANMRAEVDDMIATLEQRLGHLKQIARRGATHVSENANDMMFDPISGFSGQMADRMQSNAQAVTTEMSRMGNNAMKRLAKEVDRHPLLTLAVVAGIGFIAGLARRTE
jgi:ElaB/YqjD/DUF883 family membrane-anchored ribosome-binding protein